MIKAIPNESEKLRVCTRICVWIALSASHHVGKLKYINIYFFREFGRKGYVLYFGLWMLETKLQRTFVIPPPPTVFQYSILYFAAGIFCILHFATLRNFIGGQRQTDWWMMFCSIYIPLLAIKRTQNKKGVMKEVPSNSGKGHKRGVRRRRPGCLLHHPKLVKYLRTRTRNARYYQVLYWYEYFFVVSCWGTWPHTTRSF